MRRFFTTDITDDTAVLSGDDAHHIARVLRMRPGGRLAVCDGQGREFEAEIVSISPERVTCRFGLARAADVESPCQATLFQCLPKAGKLETIVQKCTELGVFAVVATVSARCVAEAGGAFSHKLERCRRVALEAAKQSRRAVVPEVRAPLSLAEIDVSAFDLFLVADEEERARSLKHALREAKRLDTVGLCVGPEGGFARGEVEALVARGAVAVSLGKRILRTETAGMTMLAQLFYEVEP